MKDAFGGILSIVLITIFLVIVSGILGLVVNYSKAFRMKNYIISTIEQYEGSKGCFGGSTGESACEAKIKDYANQLGYHPNPSALDCHDYEKAYDTFCYYKNDKKGGIMYYTIVTQVDIDIPIVNKIAGLSIFQVHGDTRNVRYTWK